MYQNEEKTMSANARTQDSDAPIQALFNDGIINKTPENLATSLNLALQAITGDNFSEAEMHELQRQAWMFLGVLYGRRLTSISTPLSGNAMLHVTAKRYPFLTIVHWYVNRTPIDKVYSKSFPRSEFTVILKRDPWWAYLLWILVFILGQLPSLVLILFSIVTTGGTILSLVVSLAIGNLLARAYFIQNRLSAIRHFVSRRLLPPQPR
jgi:hypothetical protein